MVEIAKNTIVLIQPTVPAERIHDRPSLPLALLSVAAPVCGSFDVKIIDQRLNNKWQESVQKELENGALCVGLTCFTGKMIKYMLDAARFVKRSFPEIPIVLGGVHATLTIEQTLKNENIDIVVIGEGEETFKELVQALRDKTPLDKIKGIAYKENGQIKINPLRDFVDMDTLLRLPCYLIDVENYVQEAFGRRSIRIQTSRGCPFNCSFCFNHQFNRRKFRAMCAERALERIDELKKKFNVQHFKIDDDNVFVDLERFKKILIGMKEMGVTWESEGARVDLLDKMDDDYMKLLEESGCRRLYIGAESGSQKILDLICKGITPELTLKVNRRLAKYKIYPHYNLILNLPGETREDVKKTVDFAFRLLKENPNARICGMMLYTPFAGTELYNKYLENKPKTLEDWASFEFDTTSHQFSEVNRKTLEGMYITARFMDDKYKDYISNRTLRVLARLYKPIARFRLRHMFFRFFIEGWFYERFIH